MIATAVLAADYAGTFELLDTSRVGARATQPAPIVITPVHGRLVLGGDASTTATARLHINDRRWDYLLAYSPSLSVTDFELGTAPQFLQTGTAALSLRERFVQVTVSETASYGELNTAVPYQQPVIPAQEPGQAPPATGQTVTPGQTGQTPVPGMTPAAGPVFAAQGQKAQDFSFFSSDTQGGVALFERRVAISVVGGYRRSGGLGQDAQAYLPAQFGPRASLAISYAVSREDTVITVASAQNTITPLGECFPLTNPPSICRTEAPILQLQELLQSRLSGTTSLSAGAGAAVDVAVTPAGERELVIDPVATATVIEQLDARRADTLGLSLQLAPLVDIRTGLPSERIQATASLSTQVSPSVVVISSAAILKSIDVPIHDPAPIVALSGSLEARLRISPEVDVGLGAQALWENQPGYPPPLATETGYVNVTARVPTLDF